MRRGQGIHNCGIPNQTFAQTPWDKGKSIRPCLCCVKASGLPSRRYLGGAEGTANDVIQRGVPREASCGTPTVKAMCGSHHKFAATCALVRLTRRKTEPKAYTNVKTCIID